MKGILEFTLPEDQEEFQIAQDGWKYKAIINDLNNKLRSMIKYEDKEVIKIEEVRQLLWELIEQYEVTD